MSGTISLQRATAVLKQMAEGSGGPIATHWLDHAAGAPGDTAKTRRFLLKLEEAGLVARYGSSGGRAYHWKIMPPGRKFLVTFSEEPA